MWGPNREISRSNITVSFWCSEIWILTQPPKSQKKLKTWHFPRSFVLLCAIWVGSPVSSSRSLPKLQQQPKKKKHLNWHYVQANISLSETRTKKHTIFKRLIVEAVNFPEWVDRCPLLLGPSSFPCQPWTRASLFGHRNCYWMWPSRTAWVQYRCWCGLKTQSWIW